MQHNTLLIQGQNRHVFEVASRGTCTLSHISSWGACAGFASSFIFSEPSCSPHQEHQGAAGIQAGALPGANALCQRMVPKWKMGSWRQASQGAATKGTRRRAHWRPPALWLLSASRGSAPSPWHQCQTISLCALLPAIFR